MQAPRMLSADEIRMQCMTALRRPVAPKESPRGAVRLADLLLRVVTAGLWMADRPESLDTWPPGTISA